MQKFFKENFVIVLGIALPLLCVILIIGIQAFSQKDAEPPAHAILLAYNDDYYRFDRIKPKVEADGSLSVTYYTDSDRNRHDGTRQITLMLYDAATKEKKTYDISAPEDIENPEEDLQLEIPEDLQALKFSRYTVAPDDAAYDYRSRNHGFFVEVFSHSGRSRYGIIKDGIFYDIPHEDRYIGRQNFVGWVIDE